MLLNFPRRSRLDLNTSIEKKIFDIIQEVEMLPADKTLTDAVILLGQAQDKIADYVDEQLNGNQDMIKLFFDFIDKHYSHSSKNYIKELKDSFMKYLKE